MGDYDSLPSHWYDDQLCYMASELDSNSPQRILPNHHHHHHHYNRHHHQQPLPYALNASSAYAVKNNANLQCKQELGLQYKHMVQHQQKRNLHESMLIQLPQLEISNCNSLPYGSSNKNNNTRNIGNLQQSSNLSHEEQLQQGNQSFSSLYYDKGVEQVTTDWRVLDKFVASQLSNDEAAATASASASACSHHSNTEINASSTAYQVEDKGINLLENDSERIVAMGEEYANAHAGSTFSSCQIDLWK